MRSLPRPPAGRRSETRSIHYARQITRGDYGRYDYIVGMDRANLRNICRIAGGDPLGKVSLLLDHTNRPGQEVADPWYTGDFDETWRDVLDGCAGLLAEMELRD